MRSLAGGLAVALLALRPALAQDDLAKKLEDLTAAIAREPANSALYVTRSDLHRRANDIDAALADLEYAARLPGGELRGNLLAAELLLQIRRYPAATQKAEAALAVAPDDVRASMLQARGLAGQGKHAQAAAAYRRALERSQNPSPDLYLECARALAAQGPAHLGEALAVLDQGMKRIGPVVGLQLPAIEMELAGRRWDGALARVEVLAQSSPGKELWLARKGEILIQAGRPREARKAFAAALEAIGRLPPHIQKLPRTQDLVRKIREKKGARGSRSP